MNNLAIEGFPNLIGGGDLLRRALRSQKFNGRPWIVAETGRVVLPGDIYALANALRAMVGAKGRKVLGLQSRTRVIESFQLESFGHKYGEIYERIKLADGSGEPRRSSTEIET